MSDYTPNFSFRVKLAILFLPIIIYIILTSLGMDLIVKYRGRLRGGFIGGLSFIGAHLVFIFLAFINGLLNCTVRYIQIIFPATVVLISLYAFYMLGLVTGAYSYPFRGGFVFAVGIKCLLMPAGYIWFWRGEKVEAISQIEDDC